MSTRPDRARVLGRRHHRGRRDRARAPAPLQRRRRGCERRARRHVDAESSAGDVSLSLRSTRPARRRRLAAPATSSSCCPTRPTGSTRARRPATSTTATVRTDPSSPRSIRARSSAGDIRIEARRRPTARSRPSARSAPARARRRPRAPARRGVPVAQRVAQLGQRDHLHVAAARGLVGGHEVDLGRRLRSGWSIPISVAMIAVVPGCACLRVVEHPAGREHVHALGRDVAGGDVLHDRRRAAALRVDQEVGARVRGAHLGDVARADPGVDVALAVPHVHRAAR